MDTESQQLLMDVWLDEDVTEDVIARVVGAVRRRFTVMQETRWDFAPVGSTVLFVLSESHFALHTYPEHRYLSIDLYVCNLGHDLRAFQVDALAGMAVHHCDARVERRGRTAPKRGRFKAL